MTQRRAALAAVLLLLIAIHAKAADPLVGVWRLQSQELNGAKSTSESLTLKIDQNVDKQFTFAFSVLVNNIDFVSMSYAVRLDGSDGDVKNSQGQKVGTVQMTVAAPAHYKIVLQGPNRPQSKGTLTISSDGKTLMCESTAVADGRSTRLSQKFLRD